MNWQGLNRRLDGEPVHYRSSYNRGLSANMVPALAAGCIEVRLFPVVRNKIIEQGAEGVSITPEGLGKFVAAESLKWRDIIGKAGIPPIQ
jgi:hypothetical protein